MSETIFKNVADLDAWVAAALADGWTSEPIYGDHEAEDRARRMKKDGFVVQVYRRLKGHPQQPAWCKVDEMTISAWGPRGQWCVAPVPYDFDAMRASTLVCDACGQTVPEVHHVGFASKACAACLPEYRKRVEFPGWNN